MGRNDRKKASDIAYIRLTRGFIYLVAIMDWLSRYVVAWELSNTLEGAFCLEVLDRGLAISRPKILNLDQGSQFTSLEFTGCLKAHGTAISMDGRGGVFDNIFVERLWRTVKHEEVYLNHYSTVREARAGLGHYFGFYNTERIHSYLGYRTPEEVYFSQGSLGKECVEKKPAQLQHGMHLTSGQLLS